MILSFLNNQIQFLNKPCSEENITPSIELTSWPESSLEQSAGVRPDTIMMADVQERVSSTNRWRAQSSAAVQFHLLILGDTFIAFPSFEPVLCIALLLLSSSELSKLHRQPVLASILLSSRLARIFWPDKHTWTFFSNVSSSLSTYCQPQRHNLLYLLYGKVVFSSFSSITWQMFYLEVLVTQWVGWKRWFVLIISGHFLFNCIVLSTPCLLLAHCRCSLSPFLLQCGSLLPQITYFPLPLWSISEITRATVCQSSPNITYPQAFCTTVRLLHFLFNYSTYETGTL